MNYLNEMRELQKESQRLYDVEANKFWDSLTLEQRMLAFYNVISRVHQGELRDKGTYRFILYDIFGFGPEAYSIGMDCGFLELHNSIVSYEEYDKMRLENIKLRAKLEERNNEE